MFASWPITLNRCCAIETRPRTPTSRRSSRRSISGHRSSASKHATSRLSARNATTWSSIARSCWRDNRSWGRASSSSTTTHLHLDALFRVIAISAFKARCSLSCKVRNYLYASTSSWV
jgi:hypothetical protein